MRILFANSSFPAIPCGIGDYTQKLAEEMALSEGHKVTVITSKSPLISTANKRVRVRAIMSDWGPRDFFKKYLYFLKEWPSVVLVQYPSVMLGERSGLTFELPRLTRFFLPWSKVIFIVHEFARTHQSAKEELIKKSLPFAHQVWFVDPVDREEVLSIAPRFEAKTRVLDPPTGPNVPFEPIEKDRLQQLRMEVAEVGQWVIFFFGFLNSPEKGFEDLVGALSLLDRRDIVVIANGDLSQSPYHQSIVEFVRRSGMQDKINWLGYLSEESVSQWLQAADLVVLPFRSGASSSRTSLVAAIVNGAATVTTTGPALPEFLKDRENVILVPPGDVSGLSRAIEEALSSPTLIQRLRVQSRGLVSRLSWSLIAAQLIGAKGSVETQSASSSKVSK